MSIRIKKWKISFNSPVILTFGAICIVSLLLNYITGGFTNRLLFMTYRSSWLSPMTYIRLFTHVLGHSNWSHLMGNLSYILLLGPLLEEKYGSAMVLKVISVTALVTGIINNIIFPNVALLGASGVVFAFILLSSITNFRDGDIPLTFILVAAIYFGQQIYEGVFVRDNVANFTHIIGGIVGAIIGFGIQKKREQGRYHRAE